MPEIKVKRGDILSKILPDRLGVEVTPDAEWSRVIRIITPFPNDKFQTKVKFKNISDAAWDAISAVRDALTDGFSFSTAEILMAALKDEGNDIIEEQVSADNENFQVPVTVKPASTQAFVYGFASITGTWKEPRGANILKTMEGTSKVRVHLSSIGPYPFEYIGSRESGSIECDPKGFNQVNTTFRFDGRTSAVVNLRSIFDTIRQMFSGSFDVEKFRTGWNLLYGDKTFEITIESITYYLHVVNAAQYRTLLSQTTTDYNALLERLREEVEEDASTHAEQTSMHQFEKSSEIMQQYVNNSTSSLQRIANAFEEHVAMGQQNIPLVELVSMFETIIQEKKTAETLASALMKNFTETQIRVLAKTFPKKFLVTPTELGKLSKSQIITKLEI